MSKLSRILKVAGEACTLGAGVVTIFISIVAAFVAFPVFVTFVVAGVAGLICGIWGGYNESRRLRQEGHKTNTLEAKQDEVYREIKQELDEIKNNLDLHQEKVLIQVGSLACQPFLDQARTGIHKVHARVEYLRDPEVTVSGPQEGLRFFTPQGPQDTRFTEEKRPACVSEVVFSDSDNDEGAGLQKKPDLAAGR